MVTVNSCTSIGDFEAQQISQQCCSVSMAACCRDEKCRVGVTTGTWGGWTSPIAACNNVCGARNGYRQRPANFKSCDAASRLLNSKTVLRHFAIQQLSVGVPRPRHAEYPAINSCGNARAHGVTISRAEQWHVLPGTLGESGGSSRGHAKHFSRL